VPAIGAPASGLIELRGLRVLGMHGVTEEERSAAQPFELDMDVALDMTRSAASDDVADTLDYQVLAEDACKVVTERSFRLLEALADAVAGTVLEHPSVEQVTVSVRKLRPPVPLDLASAGVRITRSRR
jgi:FolB domain-containing protein